MVTSRVANMMYMIGNGWALCLRFFAFRLSFHTCVFLLEEARTAGLDACFFTFFLFFRELKDLIFRILLC